VRAEAVVRAVDGWRVRGADRGLADVERVAVIGDVHADWLALSAVADQIAVAEITGLGA
jgi:hypothetical protein